MTNEQEAHLRDVKYNVLKDLDAKYRAGQEKHKEFLPDKSGLIDEAIAEVLDLAVYLYTLRDQINNVKTKLDEVHPQ